MLVILQDTDNAIAKYQQALDKLKQLADQKDFTPEGDQAYIAQFAETKQLYLAACPPDCEATLVGPDNVTRVDFSPEKRPARLEMELRFAMYITGCLAQVGCLDIDDPDNTDICSRVVAACLHQLPEDGDWPALPFEW